MKSWVSNTDEFEKQFGKEMTVDVQRSRDESKWKIGHGIEMLEFSVIKWCKVYTQSTLLEFKICIKSSDNL